MKKMLIIALVIFLVGIFGGIFFIWRVGFSRSCNPPLPRKNITIGAATFGVELATTMVEQACGLSGRTNLEDGQGMLFPFSTSSIQTFWMKDMRFALDIIWISGNKIVGFDENVPPPASGTPIWGLKIYTSPPGVDAVLELNAGGVARHGIKVGDQVQGI